MSINESHKEAVARILHENSAMGELFPWSKCSPEYREALTSSVAVADIVQVFEK